MKLSLLDQINEDLIRFVYDESNGKIVRLLAFLELKSQQKRERIVYGLLAAVGIYLVLGHGAQLICNLVGFAYPAYASIHAIRSEDKADDTQWLTYWTIFALFSIVDFASESIMSWFPLYWLLKCVLLVYLYSPLTRGAEIIYIKYVAPAVDRYGPALAEATGSMTDSAGIATAAAYRGLNNSSLEYNDREVGAET